MVNQCIEGDNDHLRILTKGNHVHIVLVNAIEPTKHLSMLTKVWTYQALKHDGVYLLGGNPSEFEAT